MEEKITPMWKQYNSIKSEYKDYILLYRLGDFYEMFYEDAQIGSNILGIALTGRSAGNNTKAPMCGVPFHSVNLYIKKLIEAGYSIAMCEQISDPSAKGMVERKVVRVITPGTVIEDTILSEPESNYLAYIYFEKNGFAISWIDISTGEYNVYSCIDKEPLSKIQDLLSMIKPKELLSNDEFFKFHYDIPYFTMSNIKPKVFSSGRMTANTAKDFLINYFNLKTLNSFEIKNDLEILAAAQILSYIVNTQQQILKNIIKLTVINESTYMILDINTRRNLELIQNVRDGKKEGTLLGVLDRTVTPMGYRALKSIIEKPLHISKDINARLDAITELIQKKEATDKLYSLFANIKDLDRILSRILMSSINPKEILHVFEILQLIPKIKQLVKEHESELIKTLNNDISYLDKLADILNRSLDKEKINNNEHFVINSYFSKEYDEYNDIAKNAQQWISSIEQKEREQTGIKNLKVSKNNIFGFYIEVTKSFINSVPDNYIRKQTLIGSERYTIPELQEIEEKINSAEIKLDNIQDEILNKIKIEFVNHYPELKKISNSIGMLDCLISLAKSAVINNYQRPIISDEIKELKIISGRHPVVEQILKKNVYVPNDTIFDTAKRTHIISGPNMAGKSTYMRQVALITLMAHIGSFVSAESAEIPIVDRIFTRIGASDDLFTGQSTFMVEMNEIAMILNYATENSLLIIDEIGRGTSTLDGLSIAWAIITYINDKIKSKTLFSTHFHELIELNDVDGIINYHILISEKNNKINFLYKIVPGGALRSYGIEVAEIAGVNKEVISTAKQILKDLEVNNIGLDMPNKSDWYTQGNLFDYKQQSKIEKEITDLNLDNMTPLQALTYLIDVKKNIEESYE